MDLSVAPTYAPDRGSKRHTLVAVRKILDQCLHCTQLDPLRSTTQKIESVGWPMPRNTTSLEGYHIGNSRSEEHTSELQSH